MLDFHVTCGSIPTQGKTWSLTDLDGWMDRLGVTTAVVESGPARLWRDPERDDALVAACRRQGPRWLPAATLSLESDHHAIALARTARARGFACAVLHGPLFEDSRVMHEMFTALADAPLPIYRAFTYPELDLVYRIVKRYEWLTFVLAPPAFESWELNHRLIELPHVCLAISHGFCSVGQVETACRRLGAERLLYAGDLPYQHPARPLGCIQDAELDDTEKALILGGAARRLLARHGIAIEAPTCTPYRAEAALSDAPALPTAPPQSVLSQAAAAPLPFKAPCAIIDTHGHFGMDFRRPDFDGSAEALLRHVAQSGVETLYLSSTEAVLGDAEEGNRVTEALLKRYPDRLRGYLVVNPWMGEVCLESVRQCRARGFIGLKPYPHAYGHRLSDPIMAPVLELADALRLPILCHTAADDLVRMLQRWPRLKVLAAHMTFEPLEKARLARDYPDVVLEISGAGAGPDDLPRAVALAGEDKLVFGSDANSCPVGFTLYPLLTSGLSERVLRAILRDNALRFFETPL